MNSVAHILSRGIVPTMHVNTFSNNGSIRSAEVIEPLFIDAYPRTMSLLLAVYNRPLCGDILIALMYYKESDFARVYTPITVASSGRVVCDNDKLVLCLAAMRFTREYANAEIRANMARLTEAAVRQYADYIASLLSPANPHKAIEYLSSDSDLFLIDSDVDVRMGDKRETIPAHAIALHHIVGTRPELYKLANAAEFAPALLDYGFDEVVIVSLCDSVYTMRTISVQLFSLLLGGIGAALTKKE